MSHLINSNAVRGPGPRELLNHYTKSCFCPQSSLLPSHSQLYTPISAPFLTHERQEIGQQFPFPSLPFLFFHVYLIIFISLPIIVTQPANNGMNSVSDTAVIVTSLGGGVFSAHGVVCIRVQMCQSLDKALRMARKRANTSILWFIYTQS